MSVSQFVPENRAAVVARLELGQALDDAAEAAGLKSATVRGWIARGRREEEGEYREFAEAVTTARSETQIEAMTPEEHRIKVSEVARRGNVQALKLYWEMILADRNPDEDEDKDASPLAEVDELAARRSG